MYCCCLVTKSCLTFANPWSVARQAPLSMGFSRQEYWSGLPFPSPGDLPNPGIKPRSLELQADSSPTEPPGKSALGGTINPLTTRKGPRITAVDYAAVFPFPKSGLWKKLNKAHRLLLYHKMALCS